MVHCIFVTGSLLLTFALIACGICFFGPYWLSNLAYAADSNEDYIIKSNKSAVLNYNYRGLWAQCGEECVWFWENDYRLQTKKFTPLKWHLATQVLYFIGAALILIAEVFARVQLCCYPRKPVFRLIAFMVLFSAIVQAAALATFGAGATRSNKEYKALTNPSDIMDMLDKSATEQRVYIGWCYWMGVAGNVISLLSGIFFALVECNFFRRKRLDF